MKKQELIELINNGGFTNLCDVYDNIDASIREVATWLNVDKHRWYENSMTVYECEDGFVGVYWPSNLYSEWSSWEDLCETVRAFEVIEKATVTYITL